MIPLNWFLVLSAGLFALGLYGALARKNAVAVLMGVELMLNAVNINLLAFWRYWGVNLMSGPVFVVVVLAAAAAEVAVGLALIISAYRRRETVAADEIDLMKG